MTPSLSELARSGAENTPSNSGDDFERYDTSDAIWTKQFPTTAVVGTATNLSFQPDFEQDDDDNWIPKDRGEFGVVLDDPSVYTGEDDFEGTVIVEGAGEKGDDYRIYNEQDDETEVEADNGRVIFGSNSIFDGDVVEDFTHDEILLKATGSSGRSIISTLDVHGSGSAHQVGAWNGEQVDLHDGGWPETTDNLFERHPDREDGPMPRVVYEPELRPDVEGNTVVVMLHRTKDILPDSDSNSYWATIFASLDDERIDTLAEQYAEATENADPESFVTELDGERMIRLQPTTEFERSQGNLIENGYALFAPNRVSADDLRDAREEAGFDPDDVDDDYQDVDN